MLKFAPAKNIFLLRRLIWIESYNIQVKKFKRDKGGSSSVGLKQKLGSGNIIEIEVST